jgi:hypothetical protein
MVWVSRDDLRNALMRKREMRSYQEAEELAREQELPLRLYLNEQNNQNKIKDEIEKRKLAYLIGLKQGMLLKYQKEGINLHNPIYQDFDIDSNYQQYQDSPKKGEIRNGIIYLRKKKSNKSKIKRISHKKCSCKK